MSYNRYFFTLMVLILFTGSMFSQSTDSLIKNIRSKYQSIRSNLKSYDTISKEEWEESAEGGEIIGYYGGKDLKFIECVYFGETGRREIEYYFTNRQLFFVFEKHYTYNRPIYWDEKHMKEYNDSVTFDPKKTIVKEDRYYFHKEKLIRWLNNEKKEVDLSNGTNINVGKDLVADSYRLRDKIKK